MLSKQDRWCQDTQRLMSLPFDLMSWLPEAPIAGVSAAPAFLRCLMSSCLGVIMSNTMLVELTGVVGALLTAVCSLTPTKDLFDSGTLELTLGLPRISPVCWHDIYLFSWTPASCCSRLSFSELSTLRDLAVWRLFIKSWLTTGNSWSVLALPVLWLLLVSIRWMPS